ncbi:MAG: hypothetical protein K9H48_01800 [Melioribacteraceae bacterium]|nr:hypothetical protein [Melioribacteraceae bacterium]MCF8393149.1 hypothetical protein [Melioribacteraceae bacterium]MCF8418052.1 hypothetical protein [Melioribacteraceae bacterium]
MKFRFIYIVSILFLTAILTFAQEANFDWGLHDVGNIRQVVTNRGGLNAKSDNSFDFPGLINTEYPPNSAVEHITNIGLYLGAYMNGERSVTLTDGEGGQIHECFPSAEPWDTVWEVGKREVVDIPYWQGYTGISDQDFVCKYDDYGPVSLTIPDHRPLYADIVQTTYAWASAPLDQTIIVTYYITPTRYDWTRVFAGVYMNGNTGYIKNGNEYALDDESYFRAPYRLMACRDVKGGVDGQGTPIGLRFFPTPNNSSLKESFVWWNGGREGAPPTDLEKYLVMSSGNIKEDQVSTGDGTKSLTSYGPYDTVKVGDTLKLSFALIVADDERDLIERAEFIAQIRARNYKVPSPPPSPEVKITSIDKGIEIYFDQTGNPDNPENYTDPDRADGITKPFEGYRIYKSTESNSGPWTLLAQYDVINDYGMNTGLPDPKEFVDKGLLNNIEYFYTITSFTRPDETIEFPELESSKTNNSKTAIPGTPPPETVGKVAVVPNPYRGDVAYQNYSPPWERPPSGRIWMEQDRRIQFINLPSRCEIKIYTLAGDLVYEIHHDDPNRGYEDWNLTSRVGQAIASGIYLYTVEDLTNGNVQVDKFIIIK